ncbi:hypothetical protein BKA70DRAFT_1337418 [Coprinopsis sp. MPI-PUGE-AT-0042]|nr:hypothetical protein BKA70DRAFT_1337418 [Coprinopsis sp. MPI-PUGE-AT-0042]
MSLSLRVRPARYLNSTFHAHHHHSLISYLLTITIVIARRRHHRHHHRRNARPGKDGARPIRSRGGARRSHWIGHLDITGGVEEERDSPQRSVRIRNFALFAGGTVDIILTLLYYYSEN